MKCNAVIIDLDGTLVNNNVRALTHLQDNKGLNKKWSEFFNKTMEFDQPNQWCMELTKAMNKQGYKILFLTGRMATEITEEATKKWLAMYVPPEIDYELIMRPKHDTRKNSQIKLDIMMNNIMPRYNVLFAIDDMGANTAMFRGLGIPALHCADYQ